jgi:hypothetical protein
MMAAARNMARPGLREQQNETMNESQASLRRSHVVRIIESVCDLCYSGKNCGRRFQTMRYVLQSIRTFVACLLVTIFAVPRSVLAQSHVVGAADLQKETVRSTQARKHDLETVRQFLSSQKAENALKSAHINAGQVQTAVSTLSDQELAQLASRVDKAQADFAGGRLEDRDLILIILAIAALALIIVAVH